MAYAALGRVDEAIRAFERCVDTEDYEAEGMYDDEGLAPLLGEAYERLHLMYPLPKDKR